VVSSVRPVRPVRLVAFSEFHLTSTRPAGLRRALGGVFGLAIAIGATIGGGILGTPGDVAAALPRTDLYMLAWVLGGGITLLGANIFAELGAMLPRSGGYYNFARRAFGDGAGFFVGFADWINWCLGAPALALLAGDYLGGLIPVLHGHATLAGFGLLAGLVVLQWIGVQSGGRTQEVTTLLKTVALLALVIAAFVLPHPAAAAAAPVALPSGGSLLLAFGLAMQGVIFTYDSYYAVIYCGGEIQDPGRVIPRTMFQGVFLIIGIFLLLNLAYLAVVPIGAMAHDTFVGATMASALFGPAGDIVIRVIMIVSILGTVNAQIMAAPRILYAMGEDGLAPHAVTRVNAGGTPIVALIASLVVISGFMLLGSFSAVVAVGVVLVVLLYVVMFATLFRLRWREPDLVRPYRARAYPWLPGLALLIVLGLLGGLIVADPKSAIITGVVVVLSWAVGRVVKQARRAG
jgi:APA family basic amino acid/polyamine antiporter